MSSTVPRSPARSCLLVAVIASGFLALGSAVISLVTRHVADSRLRTLASSTGLSDNASTSGLYYHWAADISLITAIFFGAVTLALLVTLLVIRSRRASQR